MSGLKRTAVALALAITAIACGDDANENEGSTDPGTPNLEPLPLDVTLPIIFVHGYAGSAQQYDSQLQRFVANGYPAERIRAYEHHGGREEEGGLPADQYVAGLAEFIDDALADFEVQQVYLVGHSRGTFVSGGSNFMTGMVGGYMTDPANAAKVAKYISLDGAGCSVAMTANVPCIDPNAHGAGMADYRLSGQTHVQAATSVESFVMQYKFLVGAEPQVVDIVKEANTVTISGRAVNFPANTGRADATLEIYEVNGETAHRVSDTPLATYDLDETGNFGPLQVNPDKRYEMVLIGDSGSQHHFYGQSFLRSTPFVRLLSGAADSPSRQMTNTGDGHSALIAMRMSEWLPMMDILNISTHSASKGDTDVVNAIVPDINTMGAIPGLGAPIGIHLHDAAASPGDSSLTLLGWFGEQAFQSGVDVFMPATDPPDGTITLTSMPRGDTTRPQTIRVPNWASSSHLVTAMFADYAQDGPLDSESAE